MTGPGAGKLVGLGNVAALWPFSVTTAWKPVLMSIEYSQGQRVWKSKTADLNKGCEGVFGPRKENKRSQKPLLNHLTSEKTKPNFKSRPDAPSLLHLPGTYHPLPRNLPPTSSARNFYHPLPRGLISPCPTPSTSCSTINAISTKDYPKCPTWLKFPLSPPQTFL